MKRAIIIFNLGGPNSLDAVKPFLFNLFIDPAIISLPNPFRWALAKFISSRRVNTAKEIYGHLGGASPIKQETKLQAKALEDALKPFGEYKVFYSMRYWHPFANEVAKKVKEYTPDEIVLLPLYPQFSTTTTASSLNEWYKVSNDLGMKTPTREICCYYDDPKFIASYTELTLDKYHEAARFGKPRVLFSAHGIPLNRIKKGDPYQFQIEATVKAIVEKMAIPNLDYIVCYQSKVGPLKWLQPSTEHEISQSAKQQRVIVISPISFVSEHSETLVELDIEYKRLAESLGCVHYFRVAAVRDNKLFIEALRDLCMQPSINVCRSRVVANCAGPCSK